MISTIQPFSARKKNAAQRALDAQQTAAAADDDEDLDEMPNARLPKESEATTMISDPANSASASPPEPPLSDEQRQHRREYFREVRDTKMDRFLNDPENVVKVFFSNYASDRGDIRCALPLSLRAPIC